MLPAARGNFTKHRCIPISTVPSFLFLLFTFWAKDFFSERLQLWLWWHQKKDKTLRSFCLSKIQIPMWRCFSVTPVVLSVKWTFMKLSVFYRQIQMIASDVWSSSSLFWGAVMYFSLQQSSVFIVGSDNCGRSSSKLHPGRSPEWTCWPPRSPCCSQCLL